jgi:hypothetical protein
MFHDIIYKVFTPHYSRSIIKVVAFVNTWGRSSRAMCSSVKVPNP